MAGYIGNKAVGLNVTTGDILGDVGVGGDVTVGDDLLLNSDSAVLNIGADNDLKITHDGTNGDFESAGNLTFDVVGDIILDADGAEIIFKDGGVQFGEIYKSGNDLRLESNVSDGNLVFTGNDGGTGVVALTLDMSEAGTATFNHDVKLPAAGNLFFTSASSFSPRLSNSHSDTELSFFTNNTQRVRIATAGDVQVLTGNLVIGTNGKGIDFTANTTDGSDTSELLDDYEEGTFTPGFIDNSGRGAAAMAVATGFYTKIGRMVHVHGYAVINGLGSMNGLVIFTGLPFSAVNVTNGFGAISITQAQGLATTAGHNIGMTTSPNSPNMSIRIFDSTIGTSDLTHTELSADGGFIFGGSYHVT